MTAEVFHPPVRGRLILARKSEAKPCDMAPLSCFP
jgi:hypothetical protein